MSRVFSFSSSLPVLPQDRVLGRRELQRENSEVLPKCPLSIQLGSDGVHRTKLPKAEVRGRAWKVTEPGAHTGQEILFIPTIQTGKFYDS